MVQLSKTLIAGCAVLALAACSTTDTTPEGTKRVETWSSNTVWVDGEAQTTRSHTVDYEKLPEKGPEWEFQGIWRVEDYTDTRIGDRDCLVELFPAKVGTYNYRSRLTNECSGDMRNIAAWRPVGNPVGDVIILVDSSGTNIGEFDRVSRSLFRGVFTLTSGEVVKAHFKAW